MDELKKIIEQIQATFSDFRKANDQAIAELKASGCQDGGQGSEATSSGQKPQP